MRIFLVIYIVANGNVFCVLLFALWIKWWIAAYQPTPVCSKVGNWHKVVIEVVDRL